MQIILINNTFLVDSTTKQEDFGPGAIHCNVWFFQSDKLHLNQLVSMKGRVQEIKIENRN